MDVTQTIRYVGLYEEATVLRRMLEEEGVHVELPPSARAWLELMARQYQEMLDLERRDWHEGWERREQEWNDYADRLGRERDVLRERYAQELREQQQGDQERRIQERIDRVQRWRSSGGPGSPPPLDLPQRVNIPADIYQVDINLVATGGATAIAMAVENFSKLVPHANVDVVGKAHTSKDERPPPPHAHSA